jgi:hypothetical protein
MTIKRVRAPLAALLAASAACSQPDGAAHTHESQASGGGATPQPTEAGQAAFAALSEVVRILEADSSTDWNAVRLEALRQHLVDMNLVTLEANVSTNEVPAGVSMDVTGAGRVAAAIERMLIPHAAMLNAMPAWTAQATAIPGGVRLAVLARTPSDSTVVRRIRGLGFPGLLVQDDHHTAHHLMIARGLDAHSHDAGTPHSHQPRRE